MHRTIWNIKQLKPGTKALSTTLHRPWTWRARNEVGARGEGTGVWSNVPLRSAAVGALEEQLWTGEEWDVGSQVDPHPLQLHAACLEWSLLITTLEGMDFKNAPKYGTSCMREQWTISVHLLIGEVLGYGNAFCSGPPPLSEWGQTQIGGTPHISKIKSRSRPLSPSMLCHNPI